MPSIQISHSVWIDSPVCCVVLIGVTETGQSASVDIGGDEIRPYFYVVFPDGIEKRQSCVADTVKDLVIYLNEVCACT